MCQQAISIRTNSLYIPVTYLIKYSLGIDIPVSSILPAKTITPGIVKAIFKEKTNSFVYKIFCQIHKELSDDDKSFLLADSWMLEIMKSWTNDENHPYRNAVKKTVFDMIMQTSI